jgi:hypothetical protein
LRLLRLLVFVLGLVGIDFRQIRPLHFDIWA